MATSIRPAPTTVPSTARIRVEAGPAGAWEAGLLVPAASSITDGTSNTAARGSHPQSLHFTMADGSVRFVRGSPSRLWGQPQALRGGFGLVLPAAARLRFQAGTVLPQFHILPYIEQENLYKQQGIKLDRVKVSSVMLAGGDVAVLLEPSGIIAVLIGL